MDEAAVFRLLDELAEFGRANDARETDRSRRMLNITPDVGRLLSMLARVLNARHILELGTSNGYSTIWLAWAATATGGTSQPSRRHRTRSRWRAKTWPGSISSTG